MRKWFSLGLILAFVIIFSLAPVKAASSWDASTTDIRSEIRQGEDALVELSIINNQLSPDTYRLFVDTFSFGVRTAEPSDYLSGMVVGARDVRRTTLYFRPVENLPSGVYQLGITVNSAQEGTSKTQYVFIRIRSDKPEIRDYFAAVDRILTVPSQVDPRQPVPVQINLRNLNPKNISALTIYLQSGLVNKTLITSLLPLENKVISTQLELDPKTAPQDQVLKLQLVVDDKIVQPIIKEQFSVMEYVDLRQGEISKKNSFLTATRLKSISNFGNTKQTHTVELKTSFIDSFFTTSIPASYVINKDDATYLAWDITLNPGEELSIQTTTSYVPLFIILLGLLAAVILYFIFRSPVIIAKEASVLSTREGGIAKMKILLHVKNRTGKSFDKVVIVDKIPNLVEIEKDGELGTIKPTRIFQSSREGTTVKWEIGSLEKFEERLITYKVKSKLTILGGINLPSGSVMYSDKKNKEHITNSNRLDLTL